MVYQIKPPTFKSVFGYTCIVDTIIINLFRYVQVSAYLVLLYVWDVTSTCIIPLHIILLHNPIACY